MSDIVERLRDMEGLVADDAANEITRLRRREAELLHWLRQAQLKAENAKNKAIVARDNANHAIDYALDAELCITRALSSPQSTKP